MIGQWRPTVPPTGRIGVAITAPMATAIQQSVVAATIRLTTLASYGCRAALYIK